MSNFPRKPNPSSGRFELPEVITPSRVEFLGEQTDPADEHKKTRLRWVFEQTLHKGFAHMFTEISRRGDFYDWMILDEEKERELKKVCKPFYEAAQQSS